MRELNGVIIMDDYEKYEIECKEIREQNSKLLDAFSEWLVDKGSSSRTVDRHVSNTAFYINEFLLYEEAIEAKAGVSGVGMFLGYWFIKKAMWSSVAAVKACAASLKKFYQFMSERGDVSVESFVGLKEEIKRGLPEWTATMARYADPEIEDMAEVWGL